MFGNRNTFRLEGSSTMSKKELDGLLIIPIEHKPKHWIIYSWYILERKKFIYNEGMFIYFILEKKL